MSAVRVGVSAYCDWGAVESCVVTTFNAKMTAENPTAQE